MTPARDCENPTATAISLHLQAHDGPVRAAFARVGGADFAMLDAGRKRFLHPAELAFLARLPAERRRRSYLLGRYAAKTAIVSLLPDADPAAIDIRAGAFDQPVVRYPSAEPVAVSISHTDALACAVAFPAAFPMAVDVEGIDVERAETMRTQIADTELAAALALAESEAAACALVWTAKEALSKALGCGLTAPFAFFELDGLAPAAGGVAGRFRNFGQYRFRAWLGSGLALSLAYPLRGELETDLAAILGDCLDLGT